ncbi:MAG TPA: VWA domain-containing protein, partial [Alphaproteobacteria bacterium]|nr:VWA domain-containing protein [Alphaproteobacteria bacterium]
MISKWFLARFAAILFFFSLAAYSQTSSQGNAAQPSQAQGVFKADTRLVVVDVVVTDGNGQPVSDLKMEDFNVLEDGRHQTITSFEFQHPQPNQATSTTPSGLVTNVPRFRATSLNVILEDVLNGESTSHAYAQERLIKFLETGPAIQPTAVFVLDRSGLKMLRDFTTDTKPLRETLAHFVPQGSARVSGVYVAASAYSTKGAFHTDEQSILVTLRALSLLAQTLAGYPGRKNLIWISEGFPVNLKADGLPQIPFQHTPAGTGGEGGSGRASQSAQARAGDAAVNPTPPMPNQTTDALQSKAVPDNSNQDFASEVARVANALMNAHVALYPIDAAGLGLTDRVSSQSNMQDMAYRTGGKSFHNRNDLDTGIRE